MLTEAAIRNAKPREKPYKLFDERIPRTVYAVRVYASFDTRPGRCVLIT